MLGAALAIACGSDPSSERVRPAFGQPPPAPLEDEVALPENCDDVVAQAESDRNAAALLPVLCPDVELTPITARAVLMAADSADAARRRIELLAPFTELAALAKLVAQVHVDASIDPRLPDPARAVVTPLNEQVLATAQLARAQLYTPGLGPDAHTRARAYLAKVYAHALRQLGVGPAHPPGPLGRLLAAQAIHYGRSFCDAYWRRRVAGLYPLCAETEVSMLRAVLALEADSTAGDVPIAALELDEGRRYLLRKDTTARLEKALATATSPLAPNRLAPLASDLNRLLEHGFVDLAIGRALSLRKQGNLPLSAVEQLLHAGLADVEGDEYVQRLSARIERNRKSGGAVPSGRLEHDPDPSWPSASAIARTQLDTLSAAPSEFAYRYALAQTVLVFRARPDALRVALERAATSTVDPIVRALPTLRAVLDELDDGRLAGLRRQVATDAAIVTDPEARLRRAFALVAREAGDAAR